MGLVGPTDPRLDLPASCFPRALFSAQQGALQQPRCTQASALDRAQDFYRSRAAWPFAALPRRYSVTLPAVAATTDEALTAELALSEPCPDLAHDLQLSGCTSRTSACPTGLAKPI